jgi:hypothetical protein
MRRAPTAFVAALAALLAARPARAVDDPPGARLSWVRAEGADACPAVDAVAAQVAQLLGRDPFAGPAAQEVEVLGERADGRWRARLFLRGEDHALTGAREIVDEGSSCEALATAVSLAVALAIDPTTRAPAPPTPTAVAPPPAVRPARRAPPSARGGAVALGLHLQLGLAPGNPLGVELSAEPWASGRVGLRVGAIFLPEARVARTGGDVAFGATALSLAGCFDVARGARATLATCAVVVAGAVHAVASDLVAAPSTQRGWLGLGVSLRLDVALAGPLFAEARVDGTALPLRVQFNRQGEETAVYEQSPGALSGFVGLGLSFR